MSKVDTHIHIFECGEKSLQYLWEGWWVLTSPWTEQGNGNGINRALWRCSRSRLKSESAAEEKWRRGRPDRSLSNLPCLGSVFEFDMCVHHWGLWLLAIADVFGQQGPQWTLEKLWHLVDVQGGSAWAGLSWRSVSHGYVVKGRWTVWRC